MNITDMIAARINEMLSESGGVIKIQRNELANRIGCVPSQINYVITSRYTAEQGYFVESRRGGGGFIRIVKVQDSHQETIARLIRGIGEELSEQHARILLKKLVQDQILTLKEYRIMMSALLDSTLKGVSEDQKPVVRANLMKVMLFHCMDQE
jgi:transcriptional regulator CtsR